MKTTIELTYDELFLLEMAVDEVLWKLNENSPSYQQFRRLNELLYAQRIRLRSRYEEAAQDE